MGQRLAQGRFERHCVVRESCGCSGLFKKPYIMCIETLTNEMKIPESIQPISNGISGVIERKSALTKALVFPLAVYLVLVLQIKSTQESFGLLMVGSLLAAMIIVIVSVAIHRTIIIEEKNSTYFGIISFGVRERGYLLAFIVSAICCSPSLLFLFIPYIGEYATTVVGAYIFSRISLMFPSVAVGKPMNARDSWQATKNNQIIMIAVVFLFSSFFSALEWVMAKLGVPAVLIEVFSLFTIVFLVGALSEAYKAIMAQTARQSS